MALLADDMPFLTGGQQSNSIDANAVSADRTRRNWQKLSQGALTGSIKTSGDGSIANTPDGLEVRRDPNGAIIVDSNGVAVAVDGTTVQIANDTLTAPSLLTTKGDLLTFNTVPVRFPIGTSGQVLTVTAGAISWVTPTTVLTTATKGDLITYSTTPVLLAVGSNGQVLTADSTATDGIKWATPTSVLTTATKGDLISFSTVPALLAVGTNGQVLTANSSATDGVDWETLPTTFPHMITVTGGVSTAATAGDHILLEYDPPTGFFNTLKRGLRIHATFSGNTTSLANTYTFTIRIATLSNGTIVASFSTGAIATGSFAIKVIVDIVTTTTGASGVLDVSATGTGGVDGATSTSGTPLAFLIHNTYTKDLTSSLDVFLNGQALSASAGDTIFLNFASIEQLS